MKLLLKCLRPETVPSRRKNIKLGTRVQLFLYRRCLNKLKKWYSRYAFSDIVVLTGDLSVRITHEHRDYAFETELQRLHIPIPNMMLDCSGITSLFSDKRRRRPFYDDFYFEDRFLLEIDGEKVSIDHGKGRSFVSTFKGRLKETDHTSILAKYYFSGSLHNRISKQSKRTTVYSPRKKGGLFGDDPLLVKEPVASGLSTTTPSPAIKNVEGVTIDESF